MVGQFSTPGSKLTSEERFTLALGTRSAAHLLRSMRRLTAKVDAEDQISILFDTKGRASVRT